MASIPGSEPYVCMIPVANPNSSVPKRSRLVKRFFGASPLFDGPFVAGRAEPTRRSASRKTSDRRGKTQISKPSTEGSDSDPKRKHIAAPSAEPISASGTECSISKPPSAWPHAAKTMPLGVPTNSPSIKSSAPLCVPSNCVASDPAAIRTVLTISEGVESRRCLRGFGANAHAMSANAMKNKEKSSSPRSNSNSPIEKEQFDPM